jgi:hypothetical protein
LTDFSNPSQEFELLRVDLNDLRMVIPLVSLSLSLSTTAVRVCAEQWVLDSRQPHPTHLPQEPRAIDSFIGRPSMIGRGQGQGYLRLLAERLCAKARHWW